jgi:hypothetical protein
VSNVLANPGFETAGATSFDAAGWMRVEPAVAARLEVAEAHTGLAVAFVGGGPLFPSGEQIGIWYQDAAVEPGRLYVVSAFGYHVGGAATLQIRDDADNVLASLAAGESGTWRQFSGLVTAATTTQRFALRHSGEDNTSWYVDDCVLELVPESVAMRREPLDAYTALFNRLKTINGAAGGYYHDFSDGARIITRRRLPSTPGAPMTPFLCLPLEDTGPIDTTDEFAAGAMCTTRQPVYFFWTVSELDGVGVESSPVTGFKLLSDLLRCLMPAADAPWWNYGAGSQWIHDVSIVSKRLASEVDMVEGFPAAHGVLVVELKQLFTRGQLGPSA